MLVLQTTVAGVRRKDLRQRLCKPVPVLIDNDVNLVLQRAVVRPRRAIAQVVSVQVWGLGVASWSGLPEQERVIASR